MFYTYAHYTPEGRLFYIGKGTKKRAYSKYSRNKYWHNIVNKYGDYEVKIIQEFITEQEALDHEMQLIAKYKSEGFKICNISLGGKGNSGVVLSIETKLKISLSKKGNTPWNKGIPNTVECNKKISLAKIGTRSWNKGIPCREETKSKLREKSIGKPIHSDEFKARISALHKGNTYNLGKPSSAKQKAVASALFKGNTYGTGNTANRTWVWIGTDILTGKVVNFIGEKEMKLAGLQHSNIIKCLNGERKSHKGYTWSREAWSNA